MSRILPAMTATKVGDVEVVTSEPARSPLSQRNGNPVITFKNTMRLLLADGRELFGCELCDYTHEKIGVLRVHVKTHFAGISKKFDIPLDLTVAELLDMSQQKTGVNTALAEMTQSRNEWRETARGLQAQIAALKKAFAGLGGN